MLTPEEFSALLLRHFSLVGSISPEQVHKLYRHYRLLELWNCKTNLTAIREAGEIVVRHYCESVFLATLLPKGNASIADIGSGAGFPGIPMAVFRSDCRFALIESHQRKAVFLREATRDYANVRVLAARAESLEERFDWAVCRAVKFDAALGRLAPRVAILAGEKGTEELKRLRAVTWQDPVRVPWGDRRVVLLGDVSRGTCFT